MDVVQATQTDHWLTWVTFALIFSYPAIVMLKAFNNAFKIVTKDGVGGLEWIFMHLFPYTDIVRAATGDLYLRRFFIYPRDKDFGKNKGKGRLYLHKFYRGDEDLHMHDHPWSFTSLILTKGYWEETSDKDGLLEGGEHASYTIGPDWEKRTQKWYKPFSLIKRPAAWRHRVVLDDETPVWTLVKTGVKERSWGFWIDGFQCPWRRYDGRLGICEEVVIDGDSIEGNSAPIDE